MKQMLLQMTAAQLLMQMILTLYSLIGHRLQSGETPEFQSVVILILAGLPGVLFCSLEPGLRVQNHCRTRLRHVTVCLFLWGLECAAFCGIASAVSGIFRTENIQEISPYAFLPVMAWIEAAALAAVWFTCELFKEKRIARLYGRHDDPAD